jgi:hypothetical protein
LAKISQECKALSHIVYLKVCEKGLLKAILPTPSYRRCGDSIFEYKLLEIEAKIAKALTLALGTFAGLIIQKA